MWRAIAVGTQLGWGWGFVGGGQGRPSCLGPTVGLWDAILLGLAGVAEFIGVMWGPRAVLWAGIRCPVGTRGPRNGESLSLFGVGERKVPSPLDTAGKCGEAFAFRWCGG